ncbi:hypothetical protein LTR72_006826 [Exophiala xenobiotica]|nr:hypothetical protein LTR72_006826 [Exophiala xenobiotica]KAK5286145.1 hypothetical protein LTR14_010399 [Exophiala xenobiotica]KAK5474241.1 hypothetical protein LTR55_010028 [Exophiala xenobiotica]
MSCASLTPDRDMNEVDSLARHEKLHTRRRATKDGFATDTVVKPPTPDSLGSTDINDQSTTAPATTYDYAGAVPDEQPFDSLSTSVPQSAPQSLDVDFDLIWPDSEDLFQSIMSTETSNQWQMPLGTLPFSASPTASDVAFGTPSSFDERPSSIGTIPSGGNHQAVQDVSKMVSNLSSSVTAAAKSTSITSIFLDECLHMFFVKFIPTFPVLHRATFVFRDCAHPLLLNAIAIGSLYLGPKDAVTKGEALWRLAHTAMATSWQNLITHRGPYDTCEGVQLIITAILGQVYGALSKNRAIRSTSQAFHSLGFVWARRCGMFDSQPYPLSSVPSHDAEDAHKEQQWRLWVAREIQQRALLAHYMLDGLISQMSGVPTSVRHATNQLGLPSSDAAFEASTASEWISHMQSQPLPSSPTAPTFRSILRRLFHPHPPANGNEPSSSSSRWLDNIDTNNTITTTNTNLPLSAFSHKVILEGLQSLISDDDTDEITAVGVPTRREVRCALNQVYESITLNATLSSADRLETLLRWHSICLDTVVDTLLLCRNLCSRYDITQHIWPTREGGGPAPPAQPAQPQPQPQPPQQPSHLHSHSQTSSSSSSKNLDNLVAWVGTPAARIALLHAMAIQEIVEQLPRGRAHAIHMPSSLFATATVYAVFALAGTPALKIPCSVVWQDVILLDTNGTTSNTSHTSHNDFLSLSDLNAAAAAGTGTGIGISMGMGMSMNMSTASGMNSLSSQNSQNNLNETDTVRYIRGDVLYGSNVTSRNLLYELNSIQKLFRCLFAQWGVAYDMESVVEQWISLCH